jgi:sarcosine oxidase
MTSRSQPHVIVLGLGIAGSSIAATLAGKGFRVTGIEQFSPLHERGSSHGDTRIFRRVPHEGEAYVQMAGESFDGWQAWNRLAGENLFVPCGGIDAGPEESALVRAAEELCLRHEQPFTLLKGAAFNRRYPRFKLPADWRVVYQPASGFVRPDATRTFLHRTARAHGATLLHDTPVLAVEPLPNGARVRIGRETLTCDFLVVSAGSWLPKLLPELEFPVAAERRVLAWFQPQVAEKLCDGRMPIFCLDADGGWYGMPTPDGAVKIGHDKHLRQRIDPDQATTQPNTEDAAMLSPCVARYLSGFEAQPSAMKACIYTITADHHFLIDRHPESANVLIFSCCSGHGFKYAPAYGEIAAELIAGNSRPELDAFRLRRGDVAVTRFA